MKHNAFGVYKAAIHYIYYVINYALDSAERIYSLVWVLLCSTRPSDHFYNGRKFSIIHTISKCANESALYLRAA